MKAKQLLLLLVLFLLIFGHTCFAKFCTNCGTQLAEAARFCSSCGAQLASTATPNIPNTPNTFKPLPQRKLKIVANPQSQVNREKFIELFKPSKDYEKLINTGKFMNIVGTYPEYKMKFAAIQKGFTRVKNRLPEDLQVLGKLYLTKFLAYDVQVKLMKNLRMDKGFKEALLYSGKEQLLNINQVIDRIELGNTFSPAEMRDIHAQIQNVNNRGKKYRVTSKYLKLGMFNIKKNEAIMVLDIIKNKARVLYLGVPTINTFIQGIVSLRALEKRTTWQRENKIYFTKWARATIKPEKSN